MSPKRDWGPKRVDEIGDEKTRVNQKAVNKIGTRYDSRVPGRRKHVGATVDKWYLALLVEKEGVEKMGVKKCASHPRKAALGIIICARARDPKGPRLTGSEGSPEVETSTERAGRESVQGRAGQGRAGPKTRWEVWRKKRVAR